MIMSNLCDQNKSNRRSTKMIQNCAREIILRVRDYCEAEKFHGKPIIPLHKVRCRVAAMTGISEKTVTRITKERLIAQAQSMSPIEMKTNTTGTKRKIDSIESGDVKKINMGLKARKQADNIKEIGEQLRAKAIDSLILEYVEKEEYIKEEDNTNEEECTTEEEYNKEKGCTTEEEYTKEEYLEEEYFEDDESER